MKRSLATAIVLATGCAVPDDDPDRIGRFEVEAERTESCGDQVHLAAPEQETFWVYLRKTSDRSLLWDDGHDRLPLALDADGSFGGGIEVVVAVGDPERSSCRLSRVDRLEARLDEDDAGFSGELRHSFAALSGSDCPTAIDTVPIAEELPCDVAYDLEATRLR